LYDLNDFYDCWGIWLKPWGKIDLYRLVKTNGKGLGWMILPEQPKEANLAAASFKILIPNNLIRVL
jgi:hypothetical protein